MERLTRELVYFATDGDDETAAKFGIAYPEGVEATPERMAEIFKEGLLPPFGSAYILFDREDIRSFMDELRNHLDLRGPYPDHDHFLLRSDESAEATAKTWAERFKRSEEKTPEEYSEAAQELDSFIYG
jgi:hypothetical protein